MLFNALHTLKYFTYSLLPCSLLLQGQALASDPWGDPGWMQVFYREHLGEPKTKQHLREHGHIITLSQQQIEALSRVVQPVGKGATEELTAIPLYAKDGLNIKAVQLLYDLKDLQNLVLLPEEGRTTIALADNDLMSHLTNLLTQNYNAKKSSYNDFSNSIHQLFDRLQPIIGQIFKTKSSFSTVVDDASSFYIDIPLDSLLAEDRKHAENDSKVTLLGQPANYLQCYAFPSDDWKEKKTLTVDPTFCLRVCFSTEDGFPRVAKTGIVKCDKEFIPPAYQSMEDILKIAVGGNESLIDRPAIQEDVRDSMVNHLLLQYCLSCQEVLKKNKRLSQELKEQISWSLLCSQFSISITRREAAAFNHLVVADSSLCNGPIPEDLLKSLTERPGGAKSHNSDSPIVLENQGTILNVLRRGLGNNEPNGENIDFATQTFRFFQPERSTYTIPDQATHQLIQHEYPYFLLRFALKNNRGDHLYPRMSFSFYQGKPGESLVAQSLRKGYLKHGEGGINFVTAMFPEYSRTFLGQSIEEAVGQIADLKGLQQRRRQEYLEFINIMAQGAYNNAVSVQNYILTTPPKGTVESPTGSSQTDRLETQQLGQSMKTQREKNDQDERIDVTSFLLPEGTTLVQCLTEQNEFVKSDVMNEYLFYKKDAENKYQKFTRRVLIITLRDPILSPWLRMSWTLDGQKFFSYALQQTSQIRSVIDTAVDNPAHSELVSTFPEPPRGVHTAWTVLP